MTDGHIGSKLKAESKGKTARSAARLRRILWGVFLGYFFQLKKKLYRAFKNTNVNSLEIE
jgi:hypothetical protein